MIAGQICFDPDRLERDKQYRENVDRLTTGNLVEPDFPCISEEEEVPASFVLNGLDPRFPAQVEDYFVNRPYYQTLACLWEESGFQPEASPLKFRPLPVHQDLWAKDPKQVVENIRVRPEPLAVGTLADLFVRSPKTDAGIEAILPFVGHDQTLCGDYLLLGAYEAASPRFKHGIAASVISRFFPQLPPHISIDPAPERPRSFLWKERTDQAFPLLKKFFESLPDNSTYLLETAQTLAYIGGEREYRYLTETVLKGDPAHQSAALQALLWAGSTRPEVIPHLARVLEEKSEGLYVDKEIIAGRMDLARTKSGLPPDERLLPGLYDFLIERHGFHDKGGNYEVISQWMAACGKKGHEYLLKLALEKTSLTDDFRKGVIRTVVAVEDPAVQAKIKEWVRGSNVSYDVITALARSKSAATRQTLLELMDEFQDKENSPLGTIVAHLDGPVANGDAAVEYFLKLGSIIQKHPQPDVGQRAVESSRSLAMGYREDFARHFEKFSPAQQKGLIDQWVFEEGVLDPSKPFVVAASPKARAMLRERIRDVRQVRFSSEELWAMLFDTRYHVSVTFYLLDQFAKRGEAGTDFLMEVIKSGHIHEALHQHALMALADSSSPRADEFLAAYILHGKETRNPLLTTAIRALQIRAENPRFKAGAALALQQVFPL